MKQLTCIQKQQHPEIHYELREQQQTVIDMVIDYRDTSPNALCRTATEQFKIAFDGFWRHKVLVKDMNDSLLALVYAETWYSDTSLLRISDKLLRLKFRNNPTTELILFEDESKPLLYCRLAPTGMTGVELVEDTALSTFKEREALLGVVWFLFFPITHENKIEFAL